MRLIKRYSNRKLYDTEAKCYVTLEGLAELICGGHDIQVHDNSTGEDWTVITLTQILSDMEKKQGGLLPKRVLTDLIKSGQNR